MHYKVLKTEHIRLDGHEEREIDGTQGCIINPISDAKIFVHWLDDEGNVLTTYTLTRAALVNNKFKLINGLSAVVFVDIIRL